MGNTESYTPKYNPNEYSKVRPGKNTYKKDNQNIYWRGQIVPNADIKTFDDLGDGYGRDRRHVFYKGRTTVNKLNVTRRNLHKKSKY
jgi:hypothetical protein